MAVAVARTWGNSALGDNSKKREDGRGAKRSQAKAAPSRDVGNVLRSVWHDTINETVPDDLMDLLRKLD